MTWLGLADLALQQAAWWAAVLLAARGHPLLGGLAGLAAALLHLALRPAERPRLVRAALVAAAYGLLTDSALAAAGLAAFAGAPAQPPLSAPWMVGLWAAFGVGLTASLRRVAALPVPALALLGAAAGPLAYHAGAALGALELSGPRALAAVAAQWAAALPLLAHAARARPAAVDGAIAAPAAAPMAASASAPTPGRAAPPAAEASP